MFVKCQRMLINGSSAKSVILATHAPGSVEMRRIKEEMQGKGGQHKGASDHGNTEQIQSRPDINRGRSAYQKCSADSKSVAKQNRGASRNRSGHYEAGDGPECLGGGDRRNAVGRGRNQQFCQRPQFGSPVHSFFQSVSAANSSRISRNL